MTTQAAQDAMKKMASTMPAANRDGASLEDLLGHLENQATAKRAQDADPRPEFGPRIPQMKDRWKQKWAPGPDKRNLKKEPGQKIQPEWIRFVKTAGNVFHANPGYLQPTVLDKRTLDRLNMPDRTFAKSPSQIRYHAHSEPFAEPTDDLCQEMHRKWLQTHYEVRDQHINHVYHALNRVDKAKEIMEADARKRGITRDLLSQGQVDQPHLSPAARSGIMKLKRAVKATRKFRSAAADAFSAAGDTEKAKAFNPIRMQEEKNKARLLKAKSVPCLQLKPSTPRGSVAHVEKWSGPEHSLRHFRTTTTWQREDDMKELGFRPWQGTGERRKPQVNLK